MEMEYKDTSRRGKVIVILGVVLALVAGGASFYLLNQAQQEAGAVAIPRVAVVVAAVGIPARTPVQAAQLVLREVPLDAVSQAGVVTDPNQLVGKVLAIPVQAGQPLYVNMVASASSGSGFSILGPAETIAPDSEAWRAVSITIPDDRAVGGLLQPGQTIDIFMTTTMTVRPDLQPVGIYYSDFATKVTYQDVVILARTGALYVIRTSLAGAEEINHMLASGQVNFSAALRPDQDVRYVDVRTLGATTSRILEKYGLPFPPVYPDTDGRIPPQPPDATPAPPPVSYT
ncbi:MAG: Flp pilus assembly protein CpaB, partial [Chloroflexi bacterium]|nr:Flp pilus assembly protein CpaB [Chloroflexota bacterium]